METIYQLRVQRFAQEAAKYQRRYDKLGYVRLITFILVVACFIFILQYTLWLAILFLLLAIAGFGRLVLYHEEIGRKSAFALILEQLNHDEIRCLNHDYAWNVHGGEYLDHKHPYLSDLDIFGPHSLFQYVNRAQTRPGRNRLASWFSRGVSEADIQRRQTAVDELAGLVDLRQRLMAEAQDLDDDPLHLRNLQRWLQSDDYLLHRPGVWLARWVLPIFTLLACIGIVYLMGFFYLWVPLLIPGYLLYRTHKKITRINAETEKVATTLKTYSRILRGLEHATFVTPLLRTMQTDLTTSGSRPSVLIAKLGYQIDQLSVRQNFFGIFFNLFAMWDLHWVVALERSKELIAPHIDRWFEIISDFEALASLANLKYSNPEYHFPVLARMAVKAKGLGHPLLPGSTRVVNDLLLNDHAHVLLITGSNMAGKSTWLRSLGVNLVLANAGGPVCAQQFDFEPRPIYTSMRVADALEEGASSFYAELAKLKSVIEAVKEDPRVVFLLDEILKGTNSGDRHRGSEALLRQFIKYGGSGLVATHDLALTKLEKEFPGKIENWYFDVIIENDQLAFDYKIKRGICQSFNATLLMQQMGIEIE